MFALHFLWKAKQAVRSRSSQAGSKTESLVRVQRKAPSDQTSRSNSSTYLCQRHKYQEKKTQLTELCDAMWRNKTFRCWNAALLCFGRQSLDILDLESWHSRLFISPARTVIQSSFSRGAALKLGVFILSLQPRRLCVLSSLIADGSDSLDCSLSKTFHPCKTFI